jgi:putative ABC transport system ATP-binding protein
MSTGKTSARELIGNDARHAARSGTAVSDDFAVSLEAVTKRYARHQDDALHELTVAFPRRSFTAVMGLSGSGKSTLLQCAGGLDKPTSGVVRLGDQDLASLSRRQLSVLRRQRVGFVFQALNLVPTLTVSENIALPLRLDKRRVDKRQVTDLARRVGIADQLRRLPDTLSGGQQQRTAIARALITNPDVIFADEPTAALDPYTGEAVLALLRQAVDELHQTVIVVTHNPGVAAYADRVVLLDRGSLAGIVDSPDAAQLNSVLRRLGGGSA